MMLKPNMPAIPDAGDSRIPEGLPHVIDAHVHVFPKPIFSSVRKWFDENAYPIRYKLTSTEIFAFLLSHGVKHVVALQYAHKPGIAAQLNRYMSEKCRPYGDRVTGLATVFPGETDAEGILQEAFDSGLGGLKLHAHVQCFDMNADHLERIYDCCRRNRKPIVMHAGREPKSASYRCDPYQLCSAERVENILKNFPDLKLCVPHLGFDETAPYRTLLEKYDNLWLDTTMVIADYFPLEPKIDLGRYRSDRVMYGSDFPNIPYAWDRELKALKAADIHQEALERMCYRNAAEFFDLK